MIERTRGERYRECVAKLDAVKTIICGEVKGESLDPLSNHVAGIQSCHIPGDSLP